MPFQIDHKKADTLKKGMFSCADFRFTPIQSGVGAAINGGFSHRRSVLLEMIALRNPLCNLHQQSMTIPNPNPPIFTKNMLCK